MCQSILRHCANCGKHTDRKPTKNRAGQLCEFVYCNRACYDAHRKSIWLSKSNPCLHCGKSYDNADDAYSKNKFCSTHCRVEFKKPKPVNCIQCGVLFSAIKVLKKKDGSFRYARVNGQKTCSRTCLAEFFKSDKSRKEKISKAFTGGLHPNWLGGSSREDFRGSGWQRIAEKCRELHGRKCKRCGMTELENGRKLDVNHIIPFHQHRNKTQANKQSNLEALCRSCHTKTDWEYRKNNQMQICLDIFDQSLFAMLLVCI